MRALHEQEGGGVEYLKEQAELNPVAFLSLLGKVLPPQTDGANGVPLHIHVHMDD